MNKQNEEIMSPQNDFVFKKIFGSEGSKEITKDLVSKIIGEEIKEIEFKNTELLGEDSNDKKERLDIKAVLNSNVLCDIEIQVGNNHNDDKRILDYWAKMYRQSIEKKYGIDEHSRN